MCSRHCEHSISSEHSPPVKGGPGCQATPLPHAVSRLLLQDGRKYRRSGCRTGALATQGPAHDPRPSSRALGAGPFRGSDSDLRSRFVSSCRLKPPSHSSIKRFERRLWRGGRGESVSALTSKGVTLSASRQASCSRPRWLTLTWASIRHADPAFRGPAPPANCPTLA